jgi:hypothetical protein
MSQHQTLLEAVREIGLVSLEAADELLQTNIE